MLGLDIKGRNALHVASYNARSGAVRVLYQLYSISEVDSDGNNVFHLLCGGQSQAGDKDSTEDDRLRILEFFFTKTEPTRLRALLLAESKQHLTPAQYALVRVMSLSYPI